MGPYEIKDSNGQQLSLGGNNHHAIFEFQRKWYITYHARTLEKAVGLMNTGLGYRSPHIDELEIDDEGRITLKIGTYTGVPSLHNMNPYTQVESETFTWCSGFEQLAVTNCDRSNYLTKKSSRILSDIHSGDWSAVSQLDFGDKGAVSFEANILVRSGGSIELRKDALDGEVIGKIEVFSGKSDWIKLECDVAKITGVHNIFFLYNGEGDDCLFDFDCWRFIEK